MFDRKVWSKQYRKDHRKERNEYQRQYRKNDPSWAERKRAYQLKRNFSMSLDDYDRLAEKQNHVCAICGKPSRKKRLAVDHNHNTGKVRGLLCCYCNGLLGMIHDDAGLLSRAATYLIENGK